MRRLVLAVVAIALAVLGACGGDDDGVDPNKTGVVKYNLDPSDPRTRGSSTTTSTSAPTSVSY